MCKWTSGLPAASFETGYSTFVFVTTSTICMRLGMKLRTFLLSTLIATFSLVSLSASADSMEEVVENERTAHYRKPKIDGYRLDWCYKWAEDCGRRAANRFCRRKGHYYEVGFRIDANIGRTKILSSGRICRQDSCDGFKYVRCRKR